MKIFLSHSSAQADAASELAVALEVEGHSVFIDNQRLGAGGGYHAKIREEIERSDLFVFLVSPESVTPGRYALSELKLARQRWPNPEGRVLPVMVVPTSLEVLPAYLRAVTILSPEGNLVAETAAAVAEMKESRAAAAAHPPGGGTEPAAGQPPTYRPVELVFRPGAERAYPVELRDSPLGRLEPQSCRLDPDELEAALSVAEAGAGAVQRGIGESPMPDELRRIGAALYAALFESGLHPFLEGSLKSVDPQQGRGLRFLIDTTDAPELARLPWEFLYSGAKDDFLFSSLLTPVVRWLDLEEATPSLRVQLPLRLLIAVSTPQDRPELRVGDEIAHLDAELAELSRLGLVDTVVLEHATLEGLDRKLVEASPHILHFVGHGDFEGDDGVIILEDEDVPGRSSPVRGGSLAVLLRNHLKSLRLVFLNSCLGAAASRHDPFGGVAQSLIRRGMPAVVAMQFPVADRAAVILARHFYRYLASGYPVDAALTSARAFLFAKGYQVEWGAAALYMRAADGRLFDIPAPAGLAVAAAATPMAPVHDPSPAAPTSSGAAVVPPPASAGQPAGFELRMSTPVAIAALGVAGIAVLAALLWVMSGQRAGQPGPPLPPSPSGEIVAERIEQARTAIEDARQELPSRGWADDLALLTENDPALGTALDRAIRDAEAGITQAEEVVEKVDLDPRDVLPPEDAAAIDEAAATASQAQASLGAIRRRVAARVAAIRSSREESERLEMQRRRAEARRSEQELRRLEQEARLAREAEREAVARAEAERLRVEEQRRRAEAAAFAQAAASARASVARADDRLVGVDRELSNLDPAGVPFTLFEQCDAASRDLEAARELLARGSEHEDIDAVVEAGRIADFVRRRLEELEPAIVALHRPTEELVSVVTSSVSRLQARGSTLRLMVGGATGSGGAADGVDIGSGPSAAVGFEQRFTPRIGLEAAIGIGTLGIADADDKLGFRELTVGPAFHLTPRSRVDVRVTPLVAVVGYDDLDVGTAPASTIRLDDDFTWGIRLGVDVPLRRRWSFSASAGYLDATANGTNADAGFAVDPMSILAGVSFQF